MLTQFELRAQISFPAVSYAAQYYKY